MKVLQYSAYFCLTITLLFCGPKTPPPSYYDVTHSSKVFDRDKYYRLYLPDGYDEATDRYPVIYFFHGWGGRYKSDDNAKLEYERITDLVNKYRVILVMWDGNIEEKQPRPYNIGNHENITSDIQMKDYFIELIGHIDSSYRTLPDKNHRGIIGFSMGGLMSYFLAGKYPDKVAAAVYMTGSPEFFVGTPKTHTLYPVRYAFKNLREVQLRHHNSTKDELNKLNSEVHQGALWEGGLHYEYWTFEGGHMVDLPGRTEVFEKAMNFVVTAFENPLPKPEKWWHYDLYPEFEVYDYSVKSNKEEPGFIFLDGVSNKGFGLSTLKWLPDGPPLNKSDIEIITAPAYQAETIYQVIKYKKEDQQVSEDSIKSDSTGRLHFTTDQNGYETGIYQRGDAPDLICVDYTIGKNNRLIRIGKENKISLSILNRGGTITAMQQAKIVLTPLDSTVAIASESLSVDLKPNQRIFTTPAFSVSSNKIPPASGEPAWVKFKINISVESLEFEDELTVPVFFDVPVFESFTLDDGRKPNDSTAVYGKGNGDGVASAGEQLMVYKDGHRTRLYTDDPFVQQNMETLVDEALPAKWPDGYTLSSVIRVDPKCPDGHVIECLANYETKGFMPIERKLTWGKVSIKVAR